MLIALGDEAVEVDVDGSPGWMLETHATEAARTKPANVARLLPGVRPVGDRRLSQRGPALLDPEHKARVYRNQGWISPVLLVNGRMEGVWRHDRQGGAPAGRDRAPLGRTPKWVRTQAEAEAKRLAGFLGGELALSWVRPG